MNIQFSGNFEGFLSAVFDVYKLNIKHPNFVPKEVAVPSFFDQVLQVDVELSKTKRVHLALTKILGKQGIEQLWKTTLLEDPTIYNHLFNIIEFAIRENRSNLSDYGNPNVLMIHNAIKKIGRERHRMTAFIRFELTSDGVYNAIIEPDFDVLPLLVSHFSKRYANQKWLIFDQKRQYGIFYDLRNAFPVELSQSSTNSLQQLSSIQYADEEKQFQRLWQTYYKHTAISSRKNSPLHLRHIPKRYWKFLTEKRPQ